MRCQDRWVLCTDSKAALASLKFTVPQCLYAAFMYKIIQIKTLVNELGHGIALQWIPRHCIIQGNVDAGRLALLSHRSHEVHHLGGGWLSGLAHPVEANFWGRKLLLGSGLPSVHPGRSWPPFFFARRVFTRHVIFGWIRGIRKCLYMRAWASLSVPRSASLPLRISMYYVCAYLSLRIYLAACHIWARYETVFVILVRSSPRGDGSFSVRIHRWFY